MPTVSGKQFPYTAAGKIAATQAARTLPSVSSKPKVGLWEGRVKAMGSIGKADRRWRQSEGGVVKMRKF